MAEDVYAPREDSFLMLDALDKTFPELSKKRLRCLDMGTGTGILAGNTARLMEESGIKGEVVGADLSPDAVREASLNVPKREGIKIRFVESDLFSKVKGRFDLITFNPPYLPEDPLDNAGSVTGGSAGFETAERFVKSLGNHMSEGGICLLLISTLAGKEKTEGVINSSRLKFRMIMEKPLDFETLIVYRIQNVFK